VVEPTSLNFNLTADTLVISIGFQVEGSVISKVFPTSARLLSRSVISNSGRSSPDTNLIVL